MIKLMFSRLSQALCAKWKWVVGWKVGDQLEECAVYCA